MLQMGKIFALSLSALLIFALPAKADRMLEGAQACTRHLPKAERYHNIPTHWLAAIASTESGRYHKGLKMVLPWPWTLNVEGKAYYFDNKGEAVRKVQEYFAKGVESIDVGCMQVNMRYHGHAFADINQALEPRYNVAYAARFLRSNFDEFRSWKKATAAYHSRTPSRGKKYFSTVYSKWEKVLAKLGAVSDSEALYAERPKMRKVAANEKYAGFKVNEEKAAQKKVKMKTIKVANVLKNQESERLGAERLEKSRQNGVTVARPKSVNSQAYYQPQPLTPVAANYGQQSYNNAATYQPYLF